MGFITSNVGPDSWKVFLLFSRIVTAATMSDKSIYYSDKYYDDKYEYRHVMLPKDLAKLVPKNHLMAEAEWRGIGVQQSQGWIHYMIHQPGKPARFSLPDTLSDRRFFSPNQSRTFYCSAGPSPHPPPSKTSRERMKQRLGSANSKCCLDNYLHRLFCSFCPSFHLSFPFSSKKKKKKKNLLSSFMSCRGFSVLLRHTIRTKLYNMPCVVIKCCALFCEYMKKLFQT